MKLPSNLLNVMAGGKHEALALRWENEPCAVLECKCAATSNVWVNADNYALPFANGFEWRIKPKTLRYRVALMRGINFGAYNTTIANTTDEIRIVESLSEFVKWVDGWQEVEVNDA